MRARTKDVDVHATESTKVGAPTSQSQRATQDHKATKHRQEPRCKVAGRCWLDNARAKTAPTPAMRTPCAISREANSRAPENLEGPQRRQNRAGAFGANPIPGHCNHNHRQERSDTPLLLVQKYYQSPCFGPSARARNASATASGG